MLLEGGKIVRRHIDHVRVRYESTSGEPESSDEDTRPDISDATTIPEVPNSHETVEPLQVIATPVVTSKPPEHSNIPGKSKELIVTNSRATPQEVMTPSSSPIKRPPREHKVPSRFKDFVHRLQ